MKVSRSTVYSLDRVRSSRVDLSADHTAVFIMIKFQAGREK